MFPQNKHKQTNTNELQILIDHLDIIAIFTQKLSDLSAPNGSILLTGINNILRAKINNLLETNNKHIDLSQVGRIKIGLSQPRVQISKVIALGVYRAVEQPLGQVNPFHIAVTEAAIDVPSTDHKPTFMHVYELAFFVDELANNSERQTEKRF